MPDADAPLDPSNPIAMRGYCWRVHMAMRRKMVQHFGDEGRISPEMAALIMRMADKIVRMNLQRPKVCKECAKSLST